MDQNTLKKRVYSLIPPKTKRELIELVQKENYPIREAGELLKVKLSTAKLIIKKYRQENNSKTKRKYIKRETLSQPQEDKPSADSKLEQTVKIKNEEENQIQNIQLCHSRPVDYLSEMNYAYWQYFYLMAQLSYR